MKSKALHIVAFDQPFPPDYGGVIDIFFKLKALSDIGIKPILHVFLYDGKKEEPELMKYCTKVYYYDRKRFKNPFSGELPYIVATRTNDDLLKNLELDNHPILFEGLHTTAYLNHPVLARRFKIVRTHNVEHTYYRALEEAESSYFKKYFFRIEAERLEQYEQVLKHAQLILPISPDETAYFSAKYSQTHYLPAFHSNDEIKSKTGQGKYVLYHGNLGVGENNKAALYLVHEVFPHIDLPCVVAGNNPTRQLVTSVKKHSHISLADHISSADILELVENAHINALVTFQSTGIKLKLLNSLFRGRYCVTNDLMVRNTGLETLCASATTAEGLVKLINQYSKMEFMSTDLEKRTNLLLRQFDNHSNAKQIEQYL